LGDFNGDGVDDFALAEESGTRVYIIYGVKGTGMPPRINVDEITSHVGIVL
jgi:hypothetical protein